MAKINSAMTMKNTPHIASPTEKHPIASAILIPPTIGSRALLMRQSYHGMRNGVLHTVYGS